MDPIKKYLYALILLLVTANMAHAEVLLSERDEYYPVDGRGKRELLLELRRKAPHKKGKDVFPAYTQTDLKYEFSWENKGSRCAVTKVKVYLTLTYVYPRLGRSQDRSTTQWWKNQMDRYKIHEKIHGSISKRSAYDLDRLLRNLIDLNCNNAKETIKSRAQFIIRKMKEMQEDYDRVTEHGRHQERYRGPQ